MIPDEPDLPPDSPEDQPEDRPEVLPAQPNAADPRDLKKRRVKRKLDDRSQEEFLRQLLSTAIGRKFLWSILTEAHAFETRFSLSGYGFPIEQEIWFNAGQQDLGQRLYQTWDFVDHEGVALMLRENDSRFQGRKV